MPKKANVKEPNDLGPIYILPALGKLLEIILKSQIVEFFERHELFIHNQHGFGVKKSTAEDLIYLMNKISSGFE